MKTLKSKVAAIALSATLAMSLSPAAAFADTLASANADALTTQAAPVTTQAKPKMKTVYVVSGKVTNDTYSKVANTYTYNKNGLLTKINKTSTTNGEKKKSPSTIYRYKGINMTSKTFTEVEPIYSSYGKYRETRMTQRIKSKNGLPLTVKNPNGTIYIKNKYNKNGYCIESTCFHNTYGSGSGTNTYTYNAKGLPSDPMYAYDKHGNLTKSNIYTYKNTYKKNLLIKRKYYLTLSNGKRELTSTTAYSYKKMRIPAKYAFVISRQQMQLRGIDTNALP